MHTARLLFNESGFGKVTTATIASACEIAPGNLWYYFKNKQELYDAIADDFLNTIVQRQKIRPRSTETIIEDYVDFLKEFVYELRDFRFIYRDQADYGEHTDKLLESIPSLYLANQAQLRDFFQEMIKADMLDWPESELETLALNATIILRFSLEYLREQRLNSEKGSGAVRQVVRQHLTLFEAKLKPEVRAKINNAIDEMAIS